MRECADPQGENHSSHAMEDVTAAGGGRARHGAGRRSVACLLAAGAISLAGPAAARRIGLRDALRARIPLLVIVYPHDRPQVVQDAASGRLHRLEAARRDWPDWLTAASAPRAVFHDIFAEPTLREAFALLLVRPDRAALLHEGEVSDPSVHAAGFAVLRDGTDPPGGLHLVAARVRPR